MLKLETHYCIEAEQIALKHFKKNIIIKEMTKNKKSVYNPKFDTTNLSRGYC